MLDKALCRLSEGRLRGVPRRRLPLVQPDPRTSAQGIDVLRLGAGALHPDLSAAADAVLVRALARIAGG